MKKNKKKKNKKVSSGKKKKTQRSKAKSSKTPSKKAQPSKKKSKVKAKKTPKKKIQKPDSGIDGQLIGKVTHYFPHVNAAVVVIKKGSLKIGNRILIKGHTTRFEEVIQSIQIDRKPIQEAKKGDEIGLFVRERTREHDLVYKLN